jgi:hypothetical protein
MIHIKHIDVMETKGQWKESKPQLTQTKIKIDFENHIKLTCPSLLQSSMVK